MEFFKAILLGAVQGLTEFLPVSSSGHLVIGAELLNFHEQGVVFDVFLHLGTLLAVLIVFRADIMAMLLAPLQYAGGQRQGEARRYLLWDIYIVVATIPAVIVGLFFKDFIEGLFTDALVAYIMLLFTGVMMVAAPHLPQRDMPINGWRSFLVGCGQACAILPGLSRSGTTIFVGMALGIAREKIARFSFIMSIPAILGAAVLQAGDLLASPPPPEAIAGLVAGTIMSVVTGYLAIKLLLDIIRKNRLQWFGYYCLLLAGAGLGHRFLIA